MPSGVNLVTGLPFELANYESEHNILDAELKELVLSEIPNKSAKHKSKNKSEGKAKTPAKSAKSAKTVNAAKSSPNAANADAVAPVVEQK